MKHQVEAPKPVTTVHNVDRQEKRHNGVDTYTGATGDEKSQADSDDEAAGTTTTAADDEP